jgi:hypothetical protein
MVAFGIMAYIMSQQGSDFSQSLYLAMLPLAAGFAIFYLGSD